MNLNELLEDVKTLYNKLEAADAAIRANKKDVAMVMNFKRSMLNFLIMNRINVVTMQPVQKVAFVAKPKAKPEPLPELTNDEPAPPSILLADNSETNKQKRSRRKSKKDADSND